MQYPFCFLWCYPLWLKLHIVLFDLKQYFGLNLIKCIISFIHGYLILFQTYKSAIFNLMPHELCMPLKVLRNNYGLFYWISSNHTLNGTLFHSSDKSHEGVVLVKYSVKTKQKVTFILSYSLSKHDKPRLCKIYISIFPSDQTILRYNNINVYLL